MMILKSGYGENKLLIQQLTQNSTFQDNLLPFLLSQDSKSN